MNRLLICSLVSLAALPAVALAAAKPGSYSGVSSGSIPPAYGSETPRTDKGKVTFTVRSNKVVNLRLKAQKFTCGGQPNDIPITVETIKLNASGKGSATFTHPVMGPFKITITVTSGGKASGKISPRGLCDSTVKFTAKRA